MTLAGDLEHFNSLDEATQIAIISAHLADLEEEAFTRYDNNGQTLRPLQRLSILTHADEVRNLAMKELEDARQFDNDVTMARSIAKANLMDAQAIEGARCDERDDDDDEGDDLEANGPKVEYSPTDLATWAGIHMGEAIGKTQYALDQERMHFASTGEKLGKERPAALATHTFPGMNCVACGDRKSSFEVVEVACSHAYCQECVQELFKASFKDESLFPPRCCREAIEGNKLEILLPKDMREEFKERKIEFGTQNRTYCYVKTCSAFIRPRPAPQRRADCPKCGDMTCFHCKQEYHRGRCPRNEEDEAILSLAEGKGWRRCNRCNTLVELNFGCNHMTCRCSHQFYYVCGSEWKTCDCEKWDEGRLLIRAEGIVDRDGAMDEELRAARIREVVGHLRDNHECDHDRFRRINGVFDCEECHDTLTRFIYRC